MHSKYTERSNGGAVCGRFTRLTGYNTKLVLRSFTLCMFKRELNKVLWDQRWSFASFTHSPSRLYTTIYKKTFAYIYTKRHILESKGWWGTTSVFNSLTSPRSRLGVVDDLGNLPVLHWRTVVVSRGAEEQKGRLGSQRRLLCHLLQAFGAVMGVGSLRFKKWKSRKEMSPHFKVTNGI